MKIHFIWIGWIWISAVARYYNNLWYEVFGSDSSSSKFLENLEKEWIRIFIWHDEKNLSDNTNLVVYSEAIITKPDLSIEENLDANPELSKAKKLWIKNISYPEALAEIVNFKKLIAISWTHWKSTTTSIIWVMLKWSEFESSVIVWTQVPQLNNSNFYFGKSDYFVIEACEYKRSFLKYFPFITIITNIELDHLDYYKNIDDYLNAFKTFQNQTSDYIILNWEDENCLKLKDDTKNQIWIYKEYFIKDFLKFYFPKFNLQVPGEHIEFDANFAFVVWKLLWLEENYIINKINSYSWAWRRSEIIKTTETWNILMSDYGHHPTEIKLTLKAIKEKYFNKKLFVVFEPHQYSRTIELLDWFKNCFDSADNLIVRDIYFSRDKKEDIIKMPPEKFVEELKKNYPNTIYWNWLENTLKLVKEYDKKNPNSSIILLLWAWNIDKLRNEF